MISFSELWEKSENLHEATESVASCIDEVQLKLSLYKSLNLKNIDKIAKEKIIGEILFSLTKISKLDDINVYLALLNSINDHSER